MTKRLVPAPASEIYLLQNPIERIATASNQPYLFNQVAKACQYEQAFLFVADEGFVVLKPLECKARLGILVWVCWSVGASSRDWVFDEIDRLCEAVGAELVEIYSHRKGWGRVLPKYGYQAIGVEGNFTVWRKEYGRQKQQ